MNNEIPDSFPAGWQALATGECPQPGDIHISGDGCKQVLSAFHSLHPVRSTTDSERVYRKILVPHPGDLDNAGAGVSEDTKAKTYDDGKPPLAQIPWAAIRELSMVQLYGAKKYNDYNNYRKGMEITRNLSCALRHISEYVDGRDNDPESGRSHLGHALCRIAFVLQNLADGVAIDDRYKKDQP